jgi:hypothetical protein
MKLLHVIHILINHDKTREITKLQEECTDVHFLYLNCKCQPPGIHFVLNKLTAPPTAYDIDLFLWF